MDPIPFLKAKRRMETLTATVVDATGTAIGSSITIENGLVVEICPPHGQDAMRAPFFFPGFVDLHCHGGGGVSFPDDLDPDDIDRGALTHHREGTTHLVASLVSAVDPIPAIRALAEACERGTFIGIHLEGPYISPNKAGAHNPAEIRPIDLNELRAWLNEGRGWIKTMTLAPEREDASRAAGLLLENGAIPSWGHTNATSEQTATAMSSVVETAGHSPAQTATHLFNAMPGLNHRQPGPVREFLHAAKQGDLVVEMIGDGVHVATDLVADLLTYLDHPTEPGAALVTDALACAGMPNGDYVLGGMAVTMIDGTATLTGTSTIAGGGTTLGRQVSQLLHAGVGADVLARATMLAPSRALNIAPPAPPTLLKPLTGVLVDGESVRAWRDGFSYGN